MADNDLSGNLPSISAETSQALDDLLKNQQDAPEQKTEPKTKPDAGASGAPAASGPAASGPAASGAPAASGPAASGPAATGATGAPEDTAPTTDAFDEIKLPAGTKPRSAEAFDNVKRLAREKLTALETEKAELEKKYKEAAEKAGRLPTEVEAELKELREFRRKLDVEADPEFKKFDVEAKSQEDAIYAKLTSIGVVPKTIEQMKALGAMKIEWEPILEKLPGQVRRFIEVKLTQIEDFSEKKKAAIEAAKKNSEEFLQQRASQSQSARKEFVAAATKVLNNNLPDWFQERKATEKATETDRKSIEEHNKLVAEAREAVKEAMEDDSPEMRGLLALGLAQMLKLRVDLSSSAAAHKAEVAELKKQLDAANAMLEKVKKGSTNRLRDTTATTVGGTSPGAGTISERPADALDRLASEVAANRK